jgi:hypothetical protein
MRIKRALSSQVNFKNYLPLFVIVTYLCLTYWLYFFGPIKWPESNSFLLAVFLAVNTFLIIVGFSWGVRFRKTVRTALDWEHYFRWGIFTSLILFVPMTFAYTGRWPWDVVSAFSDQGKVYSETLIRLQDTRGDRLVLSLLKGMNGPFLYGAMILGFLKWRELKSINKFLIVSVALSQVVFSTLRGVDKEIGDVLIIALVAFLVDSVRTRRLSAEKIDRKNIDRSAQKKWKILFRTLSATVFMSAFLWNFVNKKMSRLGDSYSDFHVFREDIYVDYSHPVLASLPPDMAFGFSMITSYAAQGYYGLSLLLEQPFRFSFGVGHSPALTLFFDGIFGGDSAYQNTYMSMLPGLGWDDKYVWSSVYPWLASDISFYLVPFLMFLIAFFYGRVWVEAVRKNDDSAAILFCFLSIFFLYIPANNQLAQTLDSYLGFLFWLVIYLRKTKNYV